MLTTNKQKNLLARLKQKIKNVVDPIKIKIYKREYIMKLGVKSKAFNMYDILPYNKTHGFRVSVGLSSLIGANLAYDNARGAEGSLNFAGLAVKLNSTDRQSKCALLEAGALIACQKDKLMQQIDNINNECTLEGYKKCSPLVQKNAKIILQAMYDASTDLFGYEFEVYPNEDGELAIDCTPSDGAGVLTLCSPDDSVACFQVRHGVKNRFRYRMRDFPYQNLWAMLEDLQPQRRMVYKFKDLWRDTEAVKKPIWYDSRNRLAA